MEKNFLYEIGEKLNIVRESSETERAWLWRIVYSWVGLIGLSSLWDVDKENSEAVVSIKHIKARMHSVIDAVAVLNRDIFELSDDQKEYRLVNSIFELYLNNGHMYHLDYNVKRVKPVFSHNSGIALLRGVFPTNCEVSGFGLFSVDFKSSDTLSCISLEDFGKFRNENREKFLRELENQARWVEVHFNSDMEFFNMDLERGQKYWGTQYQDFKPFSLMRWRIGLNRVGVTKYALYRKSEVGWEYAELPDWRTFQPSKEYLRIVNALILSSQRKIIHFYHREKNTTIIKLGCLLPPEEENFFLLYSWPLKFIGDENPVLNPFERRMDSRVFDIFKSYLMELGYTFKEE